MTNMVSSNEFLPILNVSEDKRLGNDRDTSATPRESATASTSSSTKDETNPLLNCKREGKARRRVSFTTATTIENPPSVVVLDDISPKDVESQQDGAYQPTEDDLWNATACRSPSPNRRRSSISSLQATPHHSNMNHTPTKTHDVPIEFSQTFPQPRFLSPFRTSRRSAASSRRSSLDSCSSYSSAISSSCFSATSLASTMGFKDESFQRSKLLTCIEWLSHHVSNHLVQQLMKEVQQEHQMEDVTLQFRARRRSTSASKRLCKSKSTEGRRHSLPETQPSKPKLTPPPKRHSCSFVHCDTLSSDDSSDSSDKERRQQRLLRTQKSLDRLSSADGDWFTSSDDEMLDVGYESAASPASWDQYMTSSLPHPHPHQTALLLVDISGFTKLSTTLPLQALSRTINAYFQSIIECIQEYGGDVVKFAGDAIMAEWRQEGNNDDGIQPKDLFGEQEGGRREGGMHVVQVATACACQIIERCSDYHVYENHASKNENSPNNDNRKLLATLNVHCGVGYGTVVGFHAGDETRREYLLLGDPIPQAADAIALGKGGEVVTSPQAYNILANELNKSSGNEDEREESIGDKPRVVFSSRQDRFVTTPHLLDPAKLLLSPARRCREDSDWTAALEGWDLPALSKLQQHLSLYVHPAVVDGEVFTTIYHNNHGSAHGASSFDEGSEPSSKNEHDQRMHQSEAEIRKVFTLFLQPLVHVEITGDPEQDEDVLATLNEVLVLANRELVRFKGHLRQFIVDDKGVVLIANFGLRGSTFPRMIENHAMSFAASIQSVLRSELNVECRMGATYGNAYCGTVGGLHRHEFSVLGPAVNLAARLMGNPENQGFLVDHGVREEAHGWQFRGREPVRAKGYAEPVQIFEPTLHGRSPWSHPAHGFVGREEEIESILQFSDDVLSSGGCSSGKLILVSGGSGLGKSSLLSEAVDRIKEKCTKQKRSQLVLGQVCCEDDLFQPMSVLGPVVLDILARTIAAKPDYLVGNHQSVATEPATEMLHGHADTALYNNETALALAQFQDACEKAEIRDERARQVTSLLFRHAWPEIIDATTDEKSSNQHFSTAEEDDIARSVVAILLRATVNLDLVLVCIDGISKMDEMSWKVIQLWFEHACNLLVIGTSTPVTCKETNMAPSFWEYLFSAGLLLNRFLRIDLSPMCEADIENLVRTHDRFSTRGKCSEIGPSSAVECFAHEVYLQSGGNPQLATNIIERFSGDLACQEETFDGTSAREDINKTTRDREGGSDVAEHILHRIDAVPKAVRTHLNLAAMLGESFSANDVVRVMETYREVSERDKEEHRNFVVDTLFEAVSHGILAIDGELDVPDTDADNRFTQDDLDASPPQDFAGVLERYQFTHPLWREKILQLTLDSWQQDMGALISEVAGIGRRS